MNALDRMLRKKVLARLARLERDRVVVREAGGTTVLGDPGAAAADAAAITVNDPALWRKVAFRGGLGAGEAYVDGDFHADDLVRLLRIFARNREMLRGVDGPLARATAPLRRLPHLLRRNSRRGSRRNIGDHYDLGNDLFALFLDETMTYSAGIFPRPDASLREASVAKLDRICRRLGLRPGMRVLEIGTGWGSFAIHAAGEYGARVKTTTISREQHELAVRRVREAGLDGRVDLLLRDYRELEGVHDRVVSIEMVEAVGHEYLDGYFERIGRLLADDGLALIQAITMPDREHRRYLRSVDFIQRHVFPGSCLPSLGSLNASIARTTRLRPIGLEDLSGHYEQTLRAWRERFLARRRDVLALGYPPRFVRLWEYYLAYCEAGFAERVIGDVQFLLAGPACRDEPVLPALDGASEAAYAETTA